MTIRRIRSPSALQLPLVTTPVIRLLTKSDLAIGRSLTIFIFAMILRLLLLAKVEAKTFAFNPEPTDIGDICQRIIEEINMLSAETHPLEFCATGDHALVVVDPKLLRHILSNLLSNALKYSPVQYKVFKR
jgi:signal transduction histidine kinase